MSATYTIRYVKNKDINRALWDACIDNAMNGLVYATAKYLDRMAINWDAIIIDNFTAVLPLPWKIKYGIKYVYPPPFIQQLGIFYTSELAFTIYDDVLNVIYQNFRFGDYYFNYINKHTFNTNKANFVLYLNKNYCDLKSQYKRDLLNNLKKAKDANLFFIKTENYNKAVVLYKKYYQFKTPHVKENDYNNFLNLCSDFHQNEQLIIREVVDKNGELLAITLCIHYKKKIHVLLSTTTNIGRDKSANHFLFNELIKEFASKNLILDFEGSDIPGIAHFYKNFGSINEPYFYHHWNNLPWLIAWIKR